MSKGGIWGRFKSEAGEEPKLNMLVSGLIRRPSSKSKKCWNWSAEKTGNHTTKSSRRTTVPKREQREGEKNGNMEEIAKVGALRMRWK